MPKQFLRLFGTESMFQQTLTRLEGIPKLAAPIVVSNHDHRFIVAEQLQEMGIDDATIMLEPSAKNTAPAIALACWQSLKQGEDPLLLVLSADHLIKNIEAFHAAIEKASVSAEKGNLVTFGIKPTSPHTGYGYIKVAIENQGIGPVEAFVEKPNEEIAQSYIEAGDYLWNSGMFLFKASVFIEELKKYQPKMAEITEQAVNEATVDLDFLRVQREIFDSCPSDSIDYAVMEKTDKAMVVSLDADWSDVGSWSSLWEASELDDNNNVLRGDVIVHDVKNTLVHSEERLVTVVGVNDIVVVETADAVMVASKHKSQEIKAIVSQLKETGRSEAESHRLCYRPWGYYDSIDMGNRFQVKRICVNPGESLSLQMHHHRAEHWVVVTGTAEVTCNDEKMIRTENQSVYIPLGSKHRLHNPGVVPLEIIEVQSGSYLGEDDIVRFDDNYNRN
jgi:mannose-1-phosphate guanylyltransferase/mannose-6-phosphate isomerase